MDGRRVFCFCEKPVLVKNIWGGANAGRRFERCATRDCSYDVWIDDPLGPRACEAIEELQREITELHASYRRKMDRVREWEADKRAAIIAKLREVEVEVGRDEVEFDGVSV